MDKTRRGQVGLALGLAVAASAMATPPVDPNGGHFRLGEQRLDATHAIAVVRDEGKDDLGPQTLVYLSDVPLDAAAAAAAFDPDDAVRAQVDEKKGNYVRLCIDADGSECGLYFSPEGFNSGGYGKLALSSNDAGRIAGSWVLKEPETFFDKTYDFDLNFDVAVAPPPGKDLPANGGEPGKAYRAYIEALAKGDLPALRRLTDQDHGYRFPQDDDPQAKESLKSARDGEPLSVEIARGRIDGEDAVLWVEGVDRDDIRRRGRVRMHKEDGGWRFVESDLDSVD
jgi:hypothetical protein